MLIRNCRQEDFFDLWQMDWDPLPKERDTIYLVLAVEHRQLSFVAEEEEGNWLGVLLASRSADGTSCFLNHLLVMSSARSQGVGSALLEHLKARCREMGIRRIWFFTNEANSRFYKRMGFAENGTFLCAPLRDYARDYKGLVMTICLSDSA